MTCAASGQWKRNHNPEWYLPTHFNSFDRPMNRSNRSSSNVSYSAQNKNEIEQTKTVSFNVENSVYGLASTSTPSGIGPLEEDGAPYSAIGQVGLTLLIEHFCLSPNHIFTNIRMSLLSHGHWQYGKEDGASPALSTEYLDLLYSCLSLKAKIYLKSPTYSLIFPPNGPLERR